MSLLNGRYDSVEQRISSDSQSISNRARLTRVLPFHDFDGDKLIIKQKLMPRMMYPGMIWRLFLALCPQPGFHVLSLYVDYSYYSCGGS